MKITRETVKEVVKEMKSKGIADDDIFENFKDALRVKLINADILLMASEEIYK